MVMHIIHVYNECESPYGVGAVAFMVSTYQECWHFVWQLVVAAADKINYYDIYVHVYAIQILLILCKFIVWVCFAYVIIIVRCAIIDSRINVG